ncbi:MAG: hypothetical protein U1C12_02375 [Patescibacteria group bacterium]|nr:hypothetical protein [Patescibacteria group bacterium]
MLINSHKDLIVWQKGIELSRIAIGSASELETQIEIAKNLP